MVCRGAVLKYEDRSLIFIRIYEDTNFPWVFFCNILQNGSIDKDQIL